jgi:hypothetical protein
MERERVCKTETGEDNRCMRDKAVCVSDKDILKVLGKKMSVRYFVTLFYKTFQNSINNITISMM